MDMTTRIVMSLSAAVMAIAGLLLSFAPQELLTFASLTANPGAVLAAQVTGATLLGFALMNWMARGNTIGGIYQRPLAIGNFTHFAVAGIALAKALLSGERPMPLIVLTAVYLFFAIAFGLILFYPPASEASTAR
jgi:hypothetical protein